MSDAIIGTDTLGSILPHTLVIKHGLLFTEGGVSLQLHRRDTALSGRIFTVGHCSIPPYSGAVLHCTTCTVGGRSMPSSGLLERLTVFFGEHRLGGRPDVGGPFGMEFEGSGVGVELWSRNSHGGAIFGDWHDCPGVGNSVVRYEPAVPSFV